MSNFLTNNKTSVKVSFLLHNKTYKIPALNVGTLKVIKFITLKLNFIAVFIFYFNDVCLLQNKKLSLISLSFYKVYKFLFFIWKISLVVYCCEKKIPFMFCGS